MKNEAEGKLYTGVDLQSGSIKFFCDPNFDNAKAGQIFEAVENYDRLKARVAELEKIITKGNAAIKELFKELDKKEVGKWDIINEGYIAMEVEGKLEERA